MVGAVKSQLERAVGRSGHAKKETRLVTVHCGYSPTSTFLVHVVVYMYGPCCKLQRREQYQVMPIGRFMQ